MKNEKLAKAKSYLILGNIFFASLLLSMEFVESDEIKTFATDGERILYNAEFLESLTVSEVQFVLAHEIMHCIFQHMNRLGERDAKRWNIATDYVINDLLSRESGVGTMPVGGLLDAKIVADGGGTADGVYKLLPDETDQKNNNNKNGNGDGGGTGPLDELLAPQADAAQLVEREAAMKVKVAQARNAAKMRGALSAGLDRVLDECLKSEVEWREVLRNFVSMKTKNELSYSRPKRRFLAEDYILPSLTGEKLGPLVVAVDCSGSIGEKELGDFEAEIRAIVEDCRPSELRILYFDTEILKTETIQVEDYSSLKLSPVGGGGTSFAPIFSEIEKLDAAPVACLVLTDLCSDDFGDAPTCPVLWASTELRPPKNRKLPFGETIYLRKEK